MGSSTYRLIICWIAGLLVSGSLLAQNNIGPGNAMQYNGTSNRVNLGASFNNLTLPVTIAAWIKPGTNNILRPVFASCADQQNWHGVWLQYSNQQLTVAFGSGSGGFTINGRQSYRVPTQNLVGKWVHVAAIVRGRNDMDIYLNGILQTGTYNGNGVSMANTATGEAHIGYHRKNGDTWFNGQIDELSVWDIELTQAQIRSMMCIKIDGNSSGLLAAYDFNQAATDNTVTDLSGNGIHGTRVGAATTPSGAPVGDASIWHYSTTPFNNFTRSDAVLGQVHTISNLNASVGGYHVYSVPSMAGRPTSTCADTSYYGVFIARDNFNATASYDFELSGQYIGWRRDAPDASTWQSVSNFTRKITGEISKGEYVIDMPKGVFGADPTLYCGDSLLLTLPAGGSYLWSDGFTGSSRYIFGGDTLSVAGDDGDCRILDTIIATDAQLNIPPPPVTDTTICMGDSVFITAGGSQYSYLWGDGDTDRSRWLHAGNQYTVTISLGTCSRSETIVVRSSTGNVVSPIADSLVELCAGEFYLIELPGNLNNIVWSDGTSTHIKHISTAGTWWFEAQGPCAEYRDTVVVTIEDCSVYLWIPSAFTPNNDRINDVFEFGATGLETFHFEVYDRWGNLHFRSTDTEVFWDGTSNGVESPVGMYVWKLSGTGFRGEAVERRGTVMIIR